MIALKEDKKARFERARAEIKRKIAKHDQDKVVSWTLAAKRIAKGTAGLVKSFVNPAKAEIVSDRQAICDACEENVSCVGNGLKCCGKMINILKSTSKTCGCVISRKVRGADQVCPLGKW